MSVHRWVLRAATHPVPPRPTEQAPPQHPTAPSPGSRLTAVARKPPEPISFPQEPRLCTRLSLAIYNRRRRVPRPEQLSGCSVGVPFTREVAAAETPQLFPCPGQGRGAGSFWGTARGCPAPLSHAETGSRSPRLTGRTLHGQKKDCAGAHMRSFRMHFTSFWTPPLAVVKLLLL